MHTGAGSGRDNSDSKGVPSGRQITEGKSGPSSSQVIDGIGGPDLNIRPDPKRLEVCKSSLDAMDTLLTRVVAQAVSHHVASCFYADSDRIGAEEDEQCLCDFLPGVEKASEPTGPSFLSHLYECAGKDFSVYNYVPSEEAHFTVNGLKCVFRGESRDVNCVRCANYLQSNRFVPHSHGCVPVQLVSSFGFTAFPELGLPGGQRLLCVPYKKVLHVIQRSKKGLSARVMYPTIFAPQVFEEERNAIVRTCSDIKDAAVTVTSTVDSWNFNNVCSTLMDKFKAFFSKAGVRVTIDILLLLVGTGILYHLVSVFVSAPVWGKMLVAAVSALGLIGVFYTPFGFLTDLLRRCYPTFFPEYDDEGIEVSSSNQWIFKTLPVDDSKRQPAPIADRVLIPQDDRDGFSSLVSVGICFAQYLANPKNFDFMLALGKLRTMSTGIRTITQAAGALTSAVPEAYRAALYLKFGVSLEDNVPRVAKLDIDEGYTILERMNLPRYRTPEFKLKYHENLRKITQHIKAMDLSYDSSLGMAVLRDLHGKLLAANSNISTILGASAVRLAPVGLWLYGDSGCGKSKLRTVIGDELFSDYPEHARCFTYNISEVFMSGYNGQAMFFIDDIGSDVDAAKQSHIVSTLLTYLSNAPMTTNQAFDKGKEFTSHMVMLTSNKSPAGVVKSVNITNSEAVLRRFHGMDGLAVHCKLKKEFVSEGKNGIGNTELISGQDTEDSRNFAHVEFRISHDGTVPSPESPYLTLVQVIELIKAKYMFSLKRYATEYTNSGKEYQPLTLVAEAIALMKNSMGILPGGSVIENTGSLMDQILADEIELFNASDHGVEMKEEKVLVCQGEGASELLAALKKVSPNRTDNFYNHVVRVARDYHGAKASVKRERIIAFLKTKPLAGVLSITESMKTETKKVSTSDSSGGFMSWGRKVLRPAPWESEEKVVVEQQSVATDVEGIQPESSVQLAGLFDALKIKLAQKLKNRTFPRWEAAVTRLKTAVDGRLGLAQWGVILSAFLLVGGLITMLSHLRGASEPTESDDEMSDDDDSRDFSPGNYVMISQSDGTKKRRRMRKNRYAKSIAALRGFQPQSEEPRNFPFARSIERNYVRLNRSNAGSHRAIIGLGITDRFVLMPEHFLVKDASKDYIPDETVLLIERQGMEYSAVFYARNIYRVGADTVLLRLEPVDGRSMNAFCNIIGSFANESDLKKILGDGWTAAGKMYLLNKERALILPPCELQDFNSEWAFADGAKVSDFKKLYHYEYPTQFGDCGKLLCSTQKIYGMHVLGGMISGKPYDGFSEVVTREMLNSVLRQLECQSVPLIHDDSFLEDTSFMNAKIENINMDNVPNGFIPVATCLNPPNSFGRSTLRRSQLDGDLVRSNKKRPAPLHKRHPRCPEDMKENAKHYIAQLQSKFSERKPGLPIKLVRASMRALVDRVLPEGERRLLTFDECINTEDWKFINPVARDTSPGYPWKKPGIPGKKELILWDETKELYEYSTEFVEALHKRDAELQLGCVPDFVWVSNAKDEILSEEKIARVGAREITASPADATVLVRRYFGAFMNAFVLCGFDWGHALSMNPFSPDWHVLISKLYANSPLGIDADVRGQDSTIMMHYFEEFVNAINLWYARNTELWSLEHDRARRALMHSLAFNYTLVGDTVSMALMGNPSGHPMTAIFNCFVGRTYHMCAYLTLVTVRDDPNTEIPRQGIEGYFENVAANCLGDDIIASIKQDVSQWFNFTSIRGYLQSHGIEITPAKKEDGDYLLKPVVDLEYLSCTSRRDSVLPGCEFSPFIKQASLSKCVSYYRKSSIMSETEMVISNIVDTLRRAWFRGEQEFEIIYQDLIADFERNYATPYAFPNYEDLFREFTGFTTTQYSVIPQGLTVSTNKTSNHIGSLVDSAFQSDQKNPIEQHTDVDAKSGFDNPNLGQAVGGILRQSGPNLAMGTGVTFCQPMSIVAEYEGPVLDPFGGIDDLSFKKVCRLTYADTHDVSSLDVAGDVIASWDICPTNGLSGATTGSNVEVSSLCYWSSIHAYWRGSIRHSFHVVAPAMATCRLAVIALWNVYTVPTAITDKLSQAFAVMDVNAGSNVMVVDIPYVSNTELKCNYNGSDMTSKHSCGKLLLVLLNSYRVPDSGSSTMTVLHFEGAGEDFELYCPFALNHSLIPRIPGVAAPTLDSESIEDSPSYELVNQMELEDSHIVNTESGVQSVILLKTSTHVVNRRENPIYKYPQSVRTLLRRNYHLYRSTALVQGYTHGSFTRICDTKEVGAVKSTGIGYCCAPFKLWNGSVTYTVVSKSNMYFGYRPRVTETDAVAWQFLIGTAPGKGASEAYGIVDANVGYASFIVPFSSPFNACKIVQEEVSSLEASPGTIMFSTNASINTGFNVFVSGGDGLNLGVPYIVPSLAVTSSPIPPDVYHSPSILSPVDQVPKRKNPVRSAEAKEYRLHSQMEKPSEPVGDSVESKVGAFMQERFQPESKVEGVRSFDSHSFLSQPQLTFNDFMERPQLIHAFEWSVSDAKNAILYGITLPFSAMENTANRAISAFRYFKSDIELTIKINATRFHAGRIIAYFVPLSDHTESATTHGTSPVSQTFVPHAFIDAQASASTKLTIPYRFYAPLLSVPDAEIIGSMNLSVFVPLTVGSGGNTTVEGSIFASFPKSELRVISPESIL
jgi:hypothetical protein